VNADLDAILINTLHYTSFDLRKDELERILRASVDSRLDYTSKKLILILNRALDPRRRNLLADVETGILPKFRD